MPTRDLSHDRLRLTQLLSPAFPIGAFAHSQGLETAIAEGLVHNAAALHQWIAMVLTHGSGQMDTAFVSLARQSTVPLDQLTDLYHAHCPSRERAQEASELGRGFGALLAAMGELSPPLPYALALGHAVRNLGVPTAEILGLWLQSLAAQLVSVAVRFMPMGQAQAQQTLAALTPLIARIAAALSAATLDDLDSFTPGADLAAMRHETQDIRIFRT
jgi:urease accessory protein